MFISTLALLNRSLREDTRLLRSHAAQFLFLGIIYLYLIAAQERSPWLGAPGLWFFWWIAWLDFWFILMVAASFFSTAITEEKEEMTLGLMRMAGVGPVSLLLGKSTSRLVSALMLLSVQIPFALLAVTLGGVTPHQVLATYVALAAFMIFAANVAPFCSVVATTSRKASWMTALILAIVLFAPWVMVNLSSSSSSGPTALFFYFGDEESKFLVFSFEWIAQFSMFERLATIVQTGFTDPLISAQVVSNLVGGLLFFGLAWAVFDFFVRDENPAALSRRYSDRFTSWCRSFGISRAWQRALMWKDFHFIAGGIAGLVARFILYALLILITGFLWGVFSWPGSTIVRNRETFGGWTMSVMTIAIVVELPILASRLFHEEIKWKTWPTLMTLPLSTAQISYGKAAGCLLGLLPATCIFCLGAIYHPDGFFEALELILGGRQDLFFLMQYVFFLHLVVYVSLYMKWGAIMGAFTIIFCLNGCWMFAFTFAYLGNGNFFMSLMSMLGFFGSLLLHLAIGGRLKTLAAE